MSAQIPNQGVPAVDGQSGLLARVWFTFLSTLTKLPSERLTGSKAYNPGNILNGAGESTTVTVPGVVLSANTPMTASACFSLDLSGLSLTAYVSGTDTVTTILINATGGAINLGAGTLTAYAWRP